MHGVSGSRRVESRDNFGLWSSSSVVLGGIKVTLSCACSDFGRSVCCFNLSLSTTLINSVTFF